jgi:lysophospholipase L1-like esterase
MLSRCCAVAGISLLVLCLGCATAPSGPPPALSCPAPIQVVSPNNNPVAVTFQAPVTSGSQPVTSTCAPPSGSLFAIGTTAVGCSATVSESRVSCSFNVTVSAPPQLAKTRTLAFGDSITFGTPALCSGSTTGLRWTPAERMRPWIEGLAAPTTSYPSVLELMLKERYTAQSPTVFNAGVPGEYVTESETRRRFTRALNEQNSEIVLLQEGINDLHALDFYGIPHNQGFALVVSALRSMSLEARGRGMQPFLGTLLPQRANGCRAFGVPPRSETDLITPTNDLIRGMAATEGIDLVDLYAVFDGHLTEYLGQDGLHPSEAGYSAIANAFFDAIKQKFEKSVSTTGIGSGMRGGHGLTTERRSNGENNGDQ